MEIINKYTVVVCDHCRREHELNITTHSINTAADCARDMGLIVEWEMFEYNLYCDKVCKEASK